MFKNLSAWQIIFRLLWIYTPFALFGYITGFFIEASFLYCFVIIFSHYWQLYKLTKWLWSARSIYPPRALGIWSNVFDGIYNQQRRNVKKRNELKALVRRFRLGAEALPDGVVIYDDHRHIFWCNKLAQEMLGLKWPADKGVRIDNLIRMPEFIKYLDKHEYLTPLEIASPSNENYIYEIRVVPFEKDKWTIIVRDITQLYKLEQMRKDFIANVSHELKTPLTVMRGYLEMTEDPEVLNNRMWQQAHNMMVEQTTRMDDLVSQLLSLSRMEKHVEETPKTRVDVPNILDIMLMEAKSLSSGKHKIVASFDQNVLLYGHEAELRSAFSNLVFNAIRYTPEGGTIDIQWSANHKGEAYFSVTDTGVGIDASHIPRLTERFYRVDEARTRQTGGAGLGLSIAKHALSNHGSSLKIRSKVNEGSCFSFTIPRQFVIRT